MRVPGHKRVRLTTNWIRSRWTSSALILGYHRIADTVDDPYGLAVAPRHFAEQMEVVRRFGTPIGLRELTQRLRDRKLPPRSVVITLDDGYADSLYAASPILQRHEIPASVFVVAGYLGRELWWDELGRTLSSASFPEQIPLVSGGLRREGRPAKAGRELTPGSRQRMILELERLLEQSSENERRRVLSSLATSDPPDLAPNHRVLSEDEVVRLGDSGLIEVGAHTMTHPRLAALQPADQRSEIKASKHALEQITGRPVVSFSYPHGSLSRQTTALVREAGFERACLSSNGAALSGSDPFRLPRFWVPDQDGDEFARWFVPWLRSGPGPSTRGDGCER